jgi:hypothetical protein
MIEEVGEVSAGDLLDLGPVEVLGQQAQVTGVRGNGVVAGALADETPLEPLDRFVDQHRCLLVNGLSFCPDYLLDFPKTKRQRGRKCAGSAGSVSGNKSGRVAPYLRGGMTRVRVALASMPSQ